LDKKKVDQLAIAEVGSGNTGQDSDDAETLALDGGVFQMPVN
jgi:hypothetical protein